MNESLSIGLNDIHNDNPSGIVFNDNIDTFLPRKNGNADSTTTASGLFNTMYDINSPELTIVSAKRATRKKPKLDNPINSTIKQPGAGYRTNAVTIPDYRSNILKDSSLSVLPSAPELAAASAAQYREAIAAKSALALLQGSNDGYIGTNINRNFYQPTLYSNSSSFSSSSGYTGKTSFIPPFIANSVVYEFVKGFKSPKSWSNPTPTTHDPQRSFESHASIVIAGKIGSEQRNTDEKTTYRHRFNKIMIDMNCKEIRPGSLGWSETGYHYIDREIHSSSKNLAALLNYIKQNAVNGEEIIARTIVQVLNPEIEVVHKYHMSPESTRNLSTEDGGQIPTALEIFYDILQKRCPMLLYIISNFLMTKSFLHKNIPALIRNKMFFGLCSNKTISQVEEEIASNNMPGKSTEMYDNTNNESDDERGMASRIFPDGSDVSENEEDEYGQNPHELMTQIGVSNESLKKRRHGGGRGQKPKSLWDRWPTELSQLFAKVTYLIGIMFNMKANGGARAAASNLSLLLRVVENEQRL